VGDSRAYLWRDGTLDQVTRDHSWVEEQVALGVLNEHEARQHPWRNLVTRALAGADQPLADAGGHVRERYGIPAEGGAYLLRPDQHVCARWLKLDAPRLQAALAAALPH
jgi:3-(3-hydroxy-phenyl)propionate hydroxylase